MTAEGGTRRTAEVDRAEKIVQKKKLPCHRLRRSHTISFVACAKPNVSNVPPRGAWSCDGLTLAMRLRAGQGHLSRGAEVGDQVADFVGGQGFEQAFRHHRNWGFLAGEYFRFRDDGVLTDEA